MDTNALPKAQEYHIYTQHPTPIHPHQTKCYFSYLSFSPSRVHLLFLLTPFPFQSFPLRTSVRCVLSLLDSTYLHKHIPRAPLSPSRVHIPYLQAGYIAYMCCSISRHDARSRSRSPSRFSAVALSGPRLPAHLRQSPPSTHLHATHSLPHLSTHSIIPCMHPDPNTPYTHATYTEKTVHSSRLAALLLLYIVIFISR